MRLTLRMRLPSSSRRWPRRSRRRTSPVPAELPERPGTNYQMEHQGADLEPPPSTPCLMKVLVVGKGAREHALCWRFSQSQNVWGLFCASGNPGINRIATPVDIAPTDIGGLVRF